MCFQPHPAPCPCPRCLCCRPRGDQSQVQRGPDRRLRVPTPAQGREDLPTMLLLPGENFFGGGGWWKLSSPWLDGSSAGRVLSKPGLWAGRSSITIKKPAEWL